MKRKLRIGLFGGTFNPPHTAHAEIAKAFIDEYKLDKLYICTDNVPYHKSCSPDLVPAEHRFNMTKLAFSGISDKVTVSDMEIVRGGNTYTVDTVKELLSIYPDSEVFVLCGTDMIKSLPGWNRADELFMLASFVCASRNGEDVPAIAGARVSKLSIKADNVSSTELRSDIKSGKDSPYIETRIREYAERNLLYANEKEYDLEAIRNYAFENEDENRFIHTLGVAECALEIKNDTAPQISDNTAMAAALLHDITKKLMPEEHFDVMKKSHVMISDDDRAAVKVLHSRSAAILAKELFGASETVSRAVWNHTTGSGYMNVLDKIIFLADYIEKNRTYDECVALRKYYKPLMESSKSLSQRLISLDLCMLRAFEYTEKELIEKKAPIHRDTVLAKEFINKEIEFYKTAFDNSEGQYGK